MTTQQVLIVEDERVLAEVLADYLRAANFSVAHQQDGAEALAWLERNRADLILVDVMLPGLDGFSLIKAIRQHSQVPILLTTARVEEQDRILGLGLGADDYICKPYGPREVVARVQAVLRRTASTAAVAPNPAVASGVELDEASYELRYARQSVQLTAVEFRLMQTMRAQPGRVFDRQRLMDQIYRDGRVVSERTVDSHIKKLRRKLEALGCPEQIEAVYGLGYRVLRA